MAFIELDNPKITGRRIGPCGALVTVRECGPAGKRIKLLAVLLGGDLAKSLNFHVSPTAVCVAFGNGDDAGKLQIMANPAGKFLAKKQQGGGWLVTVKESALPTSLKARARITIDRARQVPAGQGLGSRTILSIAEVCA